MGRHARGEVARWEVLELAERFVRLLAARGIGDVSPSLDAIADKVDQHESACLLRGRRDGSQVSVLMISSEWPDAEQPWRAPFIGQMLSSLRGAGIHVDLYRFVSRRRVTNYVRAWRDVQALMRTGHFDVVHAQFGQSGLLALHPKRLPLAVTYHGSDIEGIVGPSGRYSPMGWFGRKISRHVARRSDANAVVAQRMLDRLSVPALVIPMGVDRRLFHPVDRAETRRALGLPPDRPMVLFGANPGVARKRFSLAKQAVSRVSGARLVVASGRTPEEMPLLMNASDVLIMTSMHEGSPQVVKEALMCNLPVVSVAVGDVPQRLEGLPACHVVAADPDSLARALTNTLSSPRPNFPVSVTAEFDLARIADRWAGIYRSLIGEERGMESDRP